MKSIRVQLQPGQLPDLPELRWIYKLTYLLDEIFVVPGTKIRFGLDPILGLVPGAGDFVGMLVSSSLVIAAMRRGISGKVLVKMAGNWLIDAWLGSIPLLGDIFDLFFHANQRNYLLLKEHWEEGKHTGSGAGIILSVLGVLLVIFISALYLVGLVIAWLIGIVAGGWS